jgi:hypothetical protein
MRGSQFPPKKKIKSPTHTCRKGTVFYREFEAGNLGDEGDFFEWSSLYENVLLYESRVKKIEYLGNQ